MNNHICNEIKSYVRSSALNRSEDGSFNYFDEPLIGFASATDQLFLEYKEKIGDFLLSPTELFEAEFGVGSFTGGTIISWILPITETTRSSNGQQKSLPSREWALTKFYGEQFNNSLRRYMVASLAEHGFRALAPLHSPKWRILNKPGSGPTSTWSERHAAYAAGLGTFSLNDALITAKGIAHRCGSVIVDAVLEPTPRPYQSIYEYCLHYNSNTCGACIQRCPVGALSLKGHDKETCFGLEDVIVTPYAKKEYGVEVGCCGLCQTKVPCESGIPGRR